jgi:hypothetical protein
MLGNLAVLYKILGSLSMQVFLKPDRENITSMMDLI